MSRRVLVTGAASGLGLALVRRFLAAGDRVLATDVGAEPGADLPDVAVEDALSYLPLDVRSDEQWAAALGWVRDRWGGLDVLVNNAGVAGGGRIDVSTMDEWQLVVEIDLLGVARGCHTFAAMFKAQRSGHVVNIASIAGLVHPPHMAAYNAAKAGVVALSETLSHELAPYDVRCTAVCPSFFRTNIAATMHGRDEETGARLARLVESSPLRADDIAEAVLDGIARGDELVLPDEAARAAYEHKRSDRAGYDAQMRATAHRVAHPPAAPSDGAEEPPAHTRGPGQ